MKSLESNSKHSNRPCNKQRVTQASLIVIALCAGPASADVLHGGVEKDDAATRLVRPGDDSTATAAPAGPPSFRIGRAFTAPDFRQRGPFTGLVDTADFAAALNGSATDNGGRLGLLSPAQFANIPSNKFDLGAERGDRELTLAWETWHHQLSEAIYQRWSEVAASPGKATVKIIVYKNLQVVPMMVRSSGNEEFDHDLIAAIMSLNGNQGLAFPSRSCRTQVTFEADYVAASNVRPGFSWVKNDYEKIHQSY